MTKAEIRFDRDFTIGDVDQRISGSFVEHMGRCMYNGIYEPQHPTADKNGFREDVKKLIKELGITCIRYPGGNFVSGYQWKDGIGPKEKRPAKKDMAWNTIEANQIGTDEFAAYTQDLGIELIMAGNLGTGSPKEMGELAEYCTTPGGTYWAELRRSNGAEQPYPIQHWCLGNEMDGQWQIGSMHPREYACKARDAAKMVKWIDPQAKLIACGSCTNELGHHSFGNWDRIVLEEAYDSIDYLSLHRYYNYRSDKQLVYATQDTIGDIPFFFQDLQNYLDTIIAACDYEKGRQRQDKSIMISFDEWGVITETSATPGGNAQKFGYANFSLLDALIYGGILCTFLNNTHRVKIACQSLLVNEGGMISTAPGGKAIRQTTFFPFRDVAHYATGKSLRGIHQLPKVNTPHHQEQATLTTAATFDASSGTLTVFIMNCDLEKDCEVFLQLTSFQKLKALSHTELYHPNYEQTNTFTEENRVVPLTQNLDDPVKGNLTLIVKKHSWNVYHFSAE